MYELFYYPGNASMAPHFVLEDIGAPFVLRLVDRKTNRQKAPDYMRLNPMGRIPTLLDGERIVFESAAICLHLADRHPDAGLAPGVGTADRAHLYQWLMFLTNTLQPDFMAFFYPEQHTVDAAGVAAVRASAAARLAAAYAVVDEALGGTGPYLLGGTPSIADFYLLMLTIWGRWLPDPPRKLARVRCCVDLISGRASVQRALASEGLDLHY
jgi:glutathione S-transferase